MKIDKAIMSVDDNDLYLDFWPLVSKVWKERFNITPVLIYFGDKNLDETYGEVIKKEPVKGFDLYIQTLWARMFFTTSEQENVFITSDIDMFPISLSFFVNQIEHIEDDKYVHLYGRHRPLPFCYHVAKGRTFKDVLGLADSFEDSLRDLVSSNAEHSKHMGNELWGIDESYSTSKIKSHKDQDRIVLAENGVTSRLCRSRWPEKYDLSNYVDCHSLRPVSNFKKEILEIVEQLTS